jgi:microcystin-dependent protein
MNMSTNIYHSSLAKQLLLAFMIALPLCTWAQIGVGTTTPHFSSMMEIAPGAGFNKGLLIPSITSGQRVVLDSLQGMAHGLLFFDTNLQKFYYFHKDPRKWYELDHDWIRKDVEGSSFVVGTNIYLGVPGNVGIGTKPNINPGAKVVVVGNMSVGGPKYTQDSIPPDSGLLVQRFVGIGSIKQTNINQKLRVKGSAVIEDTVRAETFLGEGVVPKFGIIMYAGSTSSTRFDATGKGVGGYKGWALCNGENGTPDLRGRFIVGAIDIAGNQTQQLDNNGGYTNTEFDEPDYDAIGKRGGSQKVTLTTAQIPEHTHPIPHSHTATDNGHKHNMSQRWNYNTGSNDGFDDETNAGGQIGDTDTGYADISVSGTDTPDSGVNDNSGIHTIENRPPYYVLAYIMKL